MNPHFSMDAGTFYTGQDTQVGGQPGGFCGRDSEDMTSNFSAQLQRELQQQQRF